MRKRVGRRKKTAAPLEVWKFGGAALADAQGLRHAATLIRAHKGPLVVAVSALAGVTDELLDGARLSAVGEGKAGAEVAASFLKRHRALALDLLPKGPPRRQLLLSLDQASREYREVCRAILALGDLPARASDLLVSRGERMASALLALLLTAEGRRSAAVDAIEI